MKKYVALSIDSLENWKGRNANRRHVQKQQAQQREAARERSTALRVLGDPAASQGDRGAAVECLREPWFRITRWAMRVARRDVRETKREERIAALAHQRREKDRLSDLTNV